MHVYTVTQFNPRTQQLKTTVFKHMERDVAMCRAHRHYALLEEMHDWGDNSSELNIAYKQMMESIA